jgi:acetylornithine/succinyldiaminopimelate/putrescine aminotransferase
MVIGKGLSGGIYPIAATCFRHKYEVVFHEDPFIHISTFGGAEVGCPVATTVLGMSSRPDFLRHVGELGALFSTGFELLKEKHPRILVRLRQLGLMMGVQMANEHCGPLFSKCAYDNDLLSVYAYNDPRIAQLLPPLIIDRELVGEIVERMDAAVDGVERILGV